MCKNNRNLATKLNQFTYSLLLAGYKVCPPTWHKEGSKPSHHSLWLITKGSGKVVLDGETFLVAPGSLVVFTPGMICNKKTTSTDFLEFYFVRFAYSMVFEEKGRWYFRQPEEVPFPLKGVYMIKNMSKAVHLLEQINSLSKRRGADVAFEQRLLFQQLLLTFIKDFHSQALSGDTKQVIEATIDYMVHHYQSTITLNDLAERAELSKSHYSRLFKKYIGYSPIDYLTHLRIDRAKELLAHSDIRIKEVSQQVGYEDELYFSRTFKKIVGVSPTQFSDEQKQG